MTPAAVEEKYGVAPVNYPDIAAMVGETSDNLPGVPGVGPKTAAKWLGQYGSLDEIIAKVDQIPGKAGESMREHLDDVIRNRSINALIRDLDLPAGPADLAFDTVWDREAIHTVFDALEFNALRVRLFEAFGDVEPQAEEGFDLEGVNLAPGERRRVAVRALLGRAHGSVCTSRARGDAAPATSSPWRNCTRSITDCSGCITVTAVGAYPTVVGAYPTAVGAYPTVVGTAYP